MWNHLEKRSQEYVNLIFGLQELPNFWDYYDFPAQLRLFRLEHFYGMEKHAYISQCKCDLFSPVGHRVRWGQISPGSCSIISSRTVVDLTSWDCSMKVCTLLEKAVAHSTQNTIFPLMVPYYSILLHRYLLSGEYWKEWMKTHNATIHLVFQRWLCSPQGIMLLPFLQPFSSALNCQWCKYSPFFINKYQTFVLDLGPDTDQLSFE